MIFEFILQLKVACGKIIEELKSKHKIEIETLNTVAKQNADDYANQEIIQIVADHKQQFEKARETVILKNNLVIIHLLNVYFLLLYIIKYALWNRSRNLKLS